LPARIKHSLRDRGDTPIRQKGFVAGDPATKVLETQYPDPTAEVFKPNAWAKSTGGTRGLVSRLASPVR